MNPTHKLPRKYPALGGAVFRFGRRLFGYEALLCQRVYQFLTALAYKRPVAVYGVLSDCVSVCRGFFVYRLPQDIFTYCRY